MGAPEHVHSHDHAHAGKTFQGTCFCGAVRFEVSGEPVAMGYCHCDSCRTWSAAPVNAFTLWKLESVRVAQGADKILSYSKNPTSHRKSCKTCGGHLYTEHPLWGVTDVYAASIRNYPYQAALHVNYQETKLRMKDGLPKFRDMPKELGGSGATLPE